MGEGGAMKFEIINPDEKVELAEGERVFLTALLKGFKRVAGRKFRKL